MCSWTLVRHVPAIFFSVVFDFTFVAVMGSLMNVYLCVGEACPQFFLSAVFVFMFVAVVVVLLSAYLCVGQSHRQLRHRS